MRPWWVVATTMAPRFRKWSTIATPERPAFGGIGARAHLVQQHERRRLEVAGHLHDRGQVGGERRQVGGDRLLVADVGVEAAEDRQQAALGRGDVQTALRHQGQEARGLEGHGLAAGVGAADHEHRLAEADADRHRHRLAPRGPIDAEALGKVRA